MPYFPPDLPPGTPPDVEGIVRARIDPLFHQIHAMLLLPIEDSPGLDIVCKQSVALVLLAVVSGVSEELRKPPRKKKMGSGQRFQRVLTVYYPWQEEPKSAGAVCGEEAAEIIYDAFRNPLTHSLWLPEKSKLLRGEITEVKLEKLEKSKKWPWKQTKPTLKTNSTGTTLNVKIFYWGVRRLIWELISEQVQRSES